MDDLKAALLTLQEMDDELLEARATLEAFAPQVAELEQPVAGLSQEIEAARARVDDLNAEIRRLQAAAEQKRQRLGVYEERLMRVRNLREQSAARAEMDLIRRAVEADDAEVKALQEQATRTELKLVDLDRQMTKLREENAPRLEVLLAEKAAAESALAVLTDRRKNHSIRIDPKALRLYERVRGGRSSMALAPMTEEGACGHCFNILPLQEQAEIKAGTGLHRCEGCGVILYVP
jgi:predicted  nucleic acid-binding Zn-ribbon protein